MAFLSPGFVTPMLRWIDRGSFSAMFRRPAAPLAAERTEPGDDLSVVAPGRRLDGLTGASRHDRYEPLMSMYPCVRSQVHTVPLPRPSPRSTVIAISRPFICATTGVSS